MQGIAKGSGVPHSHHVAIVSTAKHEQVVTRFKGEQDQQLQVTPYKQ
jgi:hypothetical protein